MDENTPQQTYEWGETKEAVANFRKLLLCSKCSNLMEEPICLGMCEHMLCRSCAGPRAGDGCVVCHSPAWVKDIQINRQLSNIIQIFCDLESLFNPAEQPDSSVSETQKTLPETALLKHKKNYKIWFSPRSRKVRCAVEHPSEVTTPDSRPSAGVAAAQLSTNTAQRQDLSVFNFTSSSQDSSSSSQRCINIKKKGNKRSKKTARSKRVQGATRATRCQTNQKMKKKRLEVINQQWGITDEEHASCGQEQPCMNGARTSSKRVSFLSPPVTSDEPQLEAPRSSTDEVSPASSAVRDSFSEDGMNASNDQSQAGLSTSSEKLATNNSSPSDNPEKPQSQSPSENTSKRTRAGQKECSLENTPKRLRTSPGRGRKSLGRLSAAVISRLSSASPKRDTKNSGEEQKGSPSIEALVSTKSHSRSPCSPGSSVGRPSSGSPSYMKRNHKGETPLHFASIKGDVEAVKELLDQGADPNLKDNAGWTPLHEACNLGHLPVVEVLVSRGALLNTPGYENDSPLHDAVMNGHAAIVKRLLQLGASQNVLNLHGRRPADYALSQEMVEIFQEAAKETQYANSHTSYSPSANLSAVSECEKRDQTLVFLASKLSPSEQRQMARLGVLLGARTAGTFSGSVSHVVVPEGQMPTTSSTLLGLLAGCWVVKYSWVEACLQAEKWLPEAEHEAGEGPQRSRINRCSLLPPLFDGCFFFLRGSFKAPTKDELTKLLREGGGQLLIRQPKPDSDVTQTLSAAAYHAQPGSDQALCTQYIIYDPQGPYKPPVVRRGKVWSAPSSWVIDCIAAFCLLPVPDP